MTTAHPPTLRVLLVDDHAVVRAGLRMLLETQPGIAIVGEAATFDDALTLAAAQPDVVLLDLDLGARSGLELLPALFEVAPATRVILLTGVRDPDAHRQAVRLGVTGLVMKDCAVTELVQAIWHVHAGQAWLDPALTAQLIGELSRARGAEPVDPEAAVIATLTRREREVIALICEGLQNREIAERLHLSESTVRHHLTSIFDKLGVGSRLELVIYAYRQQLAAPR